MRKADFFRVSARKNAGSAKRKILKNCLLTNAILRDIITFTIETDV